MATTVTIATVWSDLHPLLQMYSVSLRLCHHTLFLELPDCVNWPTAHEDSPVLLGVPPGDTLLGSHTWLYTYEMRQKAIADVRQPFRLLGFAIRVPAFVV